MVVFSFPLQVWNLQLCWLSGDGLVWVVIALVHPRGSNAHPDGLQGDAGTLLNPPRPQRCSRSPAGSGRVCCLPRGSLELSVPHQIGLMGSGGAGSIPANRHTGVGCCERALCAGRGPRPGARQSWG